jgi:copper(I)-binding protein
MPDAVSPEPAIDAAGIQIEDVWIRPPASVGGNGALYMTLTNRDDTPDRLLTVETSI